jgi:hypothetical protein
MWCIPPEQDAAFVAQMEQVYARPYEAFAPAEALRIANRLELIHTPKHGSPLFIAECELSVMTRQCLSGLPAGRCGRGRASATPVRSASIGSSPPTTPASNSNGCTRRS